jgi:hypothetical protein
MVIKLSLKDSNQVNLSGDTVLSLTENILLIANGNFSKSIRLPALNFTSANYWIDSVGRIILVECFIQGEFVSMYSISLGSDFDNLFPNAISNWGAYFFKLHYQF